MTNKSLTDADYTAAALDLGIDEATIRAVIEVETGGKSGFLDDGTPRILFERHIMWKRLKAHGFDPAKYMKDNEDVLGPDWDRQYYRGGRGEHERLEKASLIHLPSALESASWGLFQILGQNWKSLGYTSVQEFVQKMETNEREQLWAFLRFVKVNHLVNALRNKDWKNFAKGYNGAGYEQNKYHIKLQQAYDRFNKK